MNIDERDIAGGSCQNAVDFDFDFDFDSVSVSIVVEPYRFFRPRRLAGQLTEDEVLYQRTHGGGCVRNPG